MEAKLKSILVSLFLSFLLFAVVSSATTDGLFRVGLKKIKLDQNDQSPMKGIHENLTL